MFIFFFAELLFCADCYSPHTVFTRKLPYYGGGCEWVFFIISRSLLHHLLCLNKHKSYHVDNSPWSGTVACLWSGGKPGNHQSWSSRAGNTDLHVDFGFKVLRIDFVLTTTNRTRGRGYKSPSI